jgi:uncharacterized protein
VLAMQDRLVYAPTFEGALTNLFGSAGAATSSPAANPASTSSTAQPAAAAPSVEIQALIAEAAKNLAEYQRLTAEGKLGEAGQKLEQLKRVLDQLSKRP